ncbi:MAG: hypothetical protein J3R72DRAFT_490358 [Linnemannia gamsii]|nr:MAG: hypothetical protein J3R72DRAFT_496405 [Linnemannia gamsii]KAK3842554.1 MAG: hypothetical protein J3R72DRAFT_490358 [Linnemannia gamsii]
MNNSNTTPTPLVVPRHLLPTAPLPQQTQLQTQPVRLQFIHPQQSTIPNPHQVNPTQQQINYSQQQFNYAHQQTHYTNQQQPFYAHQQQSYILQAAFSPGDQFPGHLTSPSPSPVPSAASLANISSNWKHARPNVSTRMQQSRSISIMPSPAPTHANPSSSPSSSRKRQLSDVPADDNSDNNYDDNSQQIIEAFGYNPNNIDSIIDFINKNIDHSLLNNNDSKKKEGRGKRAKRGLSTNSFWLKAGMDHFIDWYSDQENYNKLQVVAPAHGHKKTDVHNELVAFLGRQGVKWNAEQVKSNIYNTDVAFRKAAGLWRVGLTGRNDRSAKAEQLLVCPYFDKLSGVMSESAAKNPPPFRESGCRGQDIIQDDDVYVVGEDGNEVNENHSTVVEDELEEITSDPEGPADNGEGSSTAPPHYKNGHTNKRRKGDFADSAVAGLGSTMLQISNQQIQSSDRLQSNIRAREVALENRERAVVEREQALLKQEREFAIDMMKRSDEARDRRMQEQEKEQAKFDALMESRDTKFQRRLVEEQKEHDRAIESKQRKIKELEDDIKKFEEKKVAWMKDLEDRLKDNSVLKETTTKEVTRLSPC